MGSHVNVDLAHADVNHFMPARIDAAVSGHGVVAIGGAPGRANVGRDVTFLFRAGRGGETSGG